MAVDNSLDFCKKLQIGNDLKLYFVNALHLRAHFAQKFLIDAVFSIALSLISDAICAFFVIILFKTSQHEKVVVLSSCMLRLGPYIKYRHD